MTNRIPGSRARCAAAGMAGFVVAAVLTSLVWWGVAPAPDPRLASEVVTRLDPEAEIGDVELLEVDSLHTGAEVLEVAVSGFDTDIAIERARERGWGVGDDEVLVVDNGAVALEVRSPTRVVVDPHRSAWPGLAIAAGGALGLSALVLITRARLRSSSGSWRRRGAVAWSLLLPVASAAVVVAGVLVTGVPGRPDAAAAAFGAVWLTWWALLPVGAVIGVLAWIRYGDDRLHGVMARRDRT